MAPPTDKEIQNIVEKKYNLDQIKKVLCDVTKQEDLEMLCNFLLNASVNVDQVRSIIYGKYEIKKNEKPDGTGYTMSVNFDLTGVAKHKLDSKLPPNLMDFVLDKSSKDIARKKRILSGLVRTDEDLDLILSNIAKGKLDASCLDAILNGHYQVNKKTKSINTLQQLDIDPLHINDKLLDDIINGSYTINQLARFLKYKFTPIEIKAVFDSGLSPSQFKGLLKGNYEISRASLEDGSGYVITLAYSKDGYKQHLQSILDRKYPVEEVLKLFKGRLGLEELEALLSMNINVPTLHALIIGDYIIQRIDNPDGSYSLDIVYNKGAGNVKEIEEIKENHGAIPADLTKSAADSIPKSKSSKPKTAEEPIVPPGEVKKRLTEAEDAVKASMKVSTAAKEPEQPIQKVAIPDFQHDKEWNIEKGSKLKVPAIFSSALKPNFYKKEVKHLGKDQLKSFYETKAERHR